MIVCGIDPGLSGGISWLKDVETFESEYIEMPTFSIETKVKITKKNKKGIKKINYINTEEVVKQLKKNKADYYFIEKSQAMPDQGSVSGFRYGVQYGQILGILAGMGIKYILVPPQRWKNAILGKRPKEIEVKEFSKQKIIELLGEDMFTTERGRFMDGPAEAFLIAYYGWKLKQSQDWL